MQYIPTAPVTSVAVTCDEAVQIIGVAEDSVNRHIPTLPPEHVIEVHIQAWLQTRREKAEQRQQIK